MIQDEGVVPAGLIKVPGETTEGHRSDLEVFRVPNGSEEHHAQLVAPVGVEDGLLGPGPGEVGLGLDEVGLGLAEVELGLGEVDVGLGEVGSELGEVGRGDAGLGLCLGFGLCPCLCLCFGAGCLDLCFRDASS